MTGVFIVRIIITIKFVGAPGRKKKKRPFAKKQMANPLFHGQCEKCGHNDHETEHKHFHSPPLYAKQNIPTVENAKATACACASIFGNQTEILVILLRATGTLE